MRGIGILLMVMGHIGYGGAFDKFIHAFHMPMFFFISGCFFRSSRYTVAVYVRKKIRSLLVPYVFTGCMCYGLWLLFLSRHEERSALLPLYHLLWTNTDGLPIAGALWFLTAMFLANICYKILDAVLHGKQLTLTIVMIATFGTLATHFLSIRLPWAMDAAFVGMGLYHIARLLREKQEQALVQRLFFMNKRDWLVAASVTSFLIMVNGAVNMRVGSYGFLPLFWVNAVMATLVLWNFSRYMDRYFRKGAEYLEGVGRDSIVYLCWNQLVILMFFKLLAHGGVEIHGIVKILILGMVLAMLYGINAFFQKRTFRICMGK